jgi:exopolyphosphatase/guanosine-5'-triphosphate,3'-diphosphate pyrophosphatase
MILAAIDIGSNAVRLLISEVIPRENGQIKYYKKIKLFRLPVRLGEDAFLLKKISEETIIKLEKTMTAFSLFIDIYNVEHYTAGATSAMRESTNSKEVIDRIRMKTGIQIGIIDGESEADLIANNKELFGSSIDERFSHLFVDVGGGSTEISLLSSKGIVKSRSFNVGTIRLFKDNVRPGEWEKMESWLNKHVVKQNPLSIIGSGGNINAVFKRSGKFRTEPILYDYLVNERDLLSKLSIDDRIYLQGLNRDRAEVIVPALNIFLFIMEKTGIKQVIVPKIGVADGLIKNLFFSLQK